MTYEEVVTFLSTGVRENFVLEFKSDFPKNLEKTLSAFANTYGGTVYIGVDETETGAAVWPPVGVPLQSGLRERVIQIALDNINPPIVPDVTVIEFPSDPSLAKPDRAILVAQVAEGENAHAVEGGTTVYLRADNVSDRRERRASIDEIEWLVNKRRKSELEAIRIKEHIIEHATEFRKLRQLKHPQIVGASWFSISAIPSFPRNPLAKPQELSQLTRDLAVQVANAVSRVPEGQPRPISEGVWCDATYSYSELQQQGMFYEEVPFWWNIPREEKSAYRPKVILSEVVGEVVAGTLAFVSRFFDAVKYYGLTTIECRLSGVRDCSFGSERRYDFSSPLRAEDTVTLVRRVLASDLQNPISLAKDIQRELYWDFGTDVADEILKRDFSPMEAVLAKR